MSTREFNELGEELFGEGWRGAVARLLRIDKRAIQRWSSGQNAVPPEVLDAMAHIAASVEALEVVRSAQEKLPRPRLNPVQGNC